MAVMRRLLPYLLGVAVVVAGAFYGFRYSKGSGQAQRQAGVVKAPVTLETLAADVAALDAKVDRNQLATNHNVKDLAQAMQGTTDVLKAIHARVNNVELVVSKVNSTLGTIDAHMVGQRSEIQRILRRVSRPPVVRVVQSSQRQRSVESVNAGRVNPILAPNVKLDGEIRVRLVPPDPQPSRSADPQPNRSADPKLSDLPPPANLPPATSLPPPAGQ